MNNMINLKWTLPLSKFQVIRGNEKTIGILGGIFLKAQVCSSINT